MHKLHTTRKRRPERAANTTQNHAHTRARAREGSRPKGQKGFDSMEDVRYLKITLESAEKAHADALRRLQWLERRLIHAQTEEEYDHIKELLDAQEKYTKETGKIEMQARWRYVDATL